ncbi:MAG: hypothetical protein JWP55_3596 [Mycobacterium sp.]|jgi:hypothetical protein|nr:hypothetical protein [Mycobacterium sp.]
MADVVVKDLADLVDKLEELIRQFEKALDLQNDDKGLWGQLNANLSMGDFADNWTAHRNAMVKAMRTMSDSVSKVDKAWTQADVELSKKLGSK